MRLPIKSEGENIPPEPPDPKVSEVAIILNIKSKNKKPRLNSD